MAPHSRVDQASRRILARRIDNESLGTAVKSIQVHTVEHDNKLQTFSTFVARQKVPQPGHTNASNAPVFEMQESTDRPPLCLTEEANWWHHVTTTEHHDPVMWMDRMSFVQDAGVSRL